MNKTCKDCVHYDVCQYHIDEETTMTVNECSHGFKDKSRYIELPCAVGDVFYIVKSYTNSYLEIVSREVISTLVKEILINKNGISIVTEEAEYNAEDIGDLIFLTKEEAEQKLKELNK